MKNFYVRIASVVDLELIWAVNIGEFFDVAAD